MENYQNSAENYKKETTEKINALEEALAKEIEAKEAMKVGNLIEQRICGVNDLLLGGLELTIGIRKEQRCNID
jgi:hypothetical protein